MKRKRRSSVFAAANLAADTNTQDIEARYGLEPVFEPGAVQRDAGEPTRFVPLCCPYCGESYLTCIDLTGGSSTYVEDCQVCCQPMELEIVLDEVGALQSFAARRMD